MDLIGNSVLTPLNMCMNVLYATGVPGACSGQKKASDPLELELAMAVSHSVSQCGCWELSPGPLQEQLALLTAEPSLSLAPKT